MRLSTVGRVQEATVSPDGRLVAYVSVEGIRPTVYVQPATGGNAIAVVPPGNATYHGLVFTPDSRRVFFRRGERTSAINELYEVPAAGGRASKVITDVDSMISFAPDGNRFVFRRDSPNAHESYLLVAAADGSGERKIATRQIAEAFVSDPVWSPDGRTVATFAINPTSDAEQRYSIVVINLPDAAVKVLGRTRWRWTRHLRWLPDGSELLATALGRASAPFQIWRVGYPGGEVLNVTNDSSDYDYVSVTADASALLTVQTNTAEALFVAPAADLTSPRRLTPDAAMRYYGVAWTPDGRILYGSDAGGQRNIWVMNADGSEPRRLTDDSFVNQDPVATPDGRYIVYRSEREGFGNIWRIDAGGGNPRQLTQRGSANNPSVTPDSRSIVYDVAAVTGARLRNVSIDGGDPEELTTTTSHYPVVSPDGKLIAFWNQPATAASTTLSIVPIGGGAPLLDFRVPAERWRWQRDGRALIYVDSAPGYSNFMRLPLNTGKPTATSAFTANRIPAFDLSRDGKRILFVGAAQQSDVVMIRGFR
jgi:Tol biopolymer transport system component